MSFLLAILCLYYGTNNILSAFKVPFSEFEVVHWLLLLTGVLLILFGIACTLLATKEYKEKQAQNANPKNTNTLLEDDDTEFNSDLFSYDLQEDSNDDDLDD